MNKLNKKSISLSLIVFLSIVNFACHLSSSLGGDWYVNDSYGHDHGFIVKNNGKEDDPFIPCAIVSYEHNDEFLIVAQKPNVDCGKSTDKFNTGNALNFWIIDIGRDRVIGPLSIDMYFQKRQELGVPSDLEMELKL